MFFLGLLVLCAAGSNKEFFEKFFSDEHFRKDVIAGVGEEFHRRNGGEQKAA